MSDRPLPPPITAAQFEGQPRYAQHYHSRSIHERCERRVWADGLITEIVPVDPSETLLWPDLRPDYLAVAIEEHYEDALTGYRIRCYGLTEKSLAAIREVTTELN